MSGFIAGRFRTVVNGPYPCWVEIRADNEFIASIRHDEIADLQFALERAKQEAMRRLKDDAHEVL